MEVHPVATNDEAHVVKLLFVRLDRVYDESISCLFIFWDFGFLHQKYFIGPGRHAGVNTLHKEV